MMKYATSYASMCWDSLQYDTTNDYMPACGSVYGHSHVPMLVDMHMASIWQHMPTYADMQQHVLACTATAMTRPHAI